MKYFIKLNAVSFIYALMAFIPVELLMNVYRISRLTNWTIGTVNQLISVTLIVELIGGTILLFILTRRWLEGRQTNYWTTIVWLPYFVGLVYMFAALFPITNAADHPNSASGLLAVGGMVAYMFYILILNTFSIKYVK